MGEEERGVGGEVGGGGGGEMWLTNKDTATECEQKDHFDQMYMVCVCVCESVCVFICFGEGKREREKHV